VAGATVAKRVAKRRRSWSGFPMVRVVIGASILQGHVEGYGPNQCWLATPQGGDFRVWRRATLKKSVGSVHNITFLPLDVGVETCLTVRTMSTNLRTRRRLTRPVVSVTLQKRWSRDGF